ncbi:MAG: hypothetical protein PHZ04_01950 [Patescibacteria group bacterium]|nr:hypothetical protein [Patescibacteria group bacterium]MDD5294509.1 hypothetical protein [Patescibacteria group bacterium]MDD5555014.1 hypothetical protein [Patescibacteria group bacterium]
MDDRIDITGVLFFAFFIIAGGIKGMLLFPGCWWLSLPIGGALGFLSAIIICFFLLLAIACAFVSILLFALAFFLLKKSAGAIEEFIKELIKLIKTTLPII